MSIYAAIKPTYCNITRYRKTNEYYEVYELIKILLEGEVYEEEAHRIAESVACWCETHFIGETYEHNLFTVTIVED